MQEQLPRRKKGRIASYVALLTTQEIVKKTSKLGIFLSGNSLMVETQYFASLRVGRRTVLPRSFEAIELRRSQ